ncbi:hypothetical protein QF028_001578 [Neobacillus sp. B4I6]|uniref:Imm32 family immunity protein n=1 Tax=Neobacillus sp. B4I6 TaxID=3373925 RepID=UPI003D1F2DF8
MKKVQKEVTLTLEYFQNKADKTSGIYEGGVVDPNIEGLIIDVTNGESFDFEANEFVSNGKYEIHLSGNREAIKELGKYLIALADYETEDPNYHDHFDNVRNSSGKEIVDFVIYKPKE